MIPPPLTHSLTNRPSYYMYTTAAAAAFHTDCLDPYEGFAGKGGGGGVHAQGGQGLAPSMLGNSVTFASAGEGGGGGHGKPSHHTKGGGGGAGSMLTVSQFGGVGGGMGGFLSAGESQASFGAGANKRGGVAATVNHANAIPHKGGDHKGGDPNSHNSVIQSQDHSRHHHNGSSGNPHPIVYSLLVGIYMLY